MCGREVGGDGVAVPDALSVGGTCWKCSLSCIFMFQPVCVGGLHRGGAAEGSAAVSRLVRRGGYTDALPAAGHPKHEHLASKGKQQGRVFCFVTCNGVAAGVVGLASCLRALAVCAVCATGFWLPTVLLLCIV
jgi:hypothetical protein